MHFLCILKSKDIVFNKVYNIVVVTVNKCILACLTISISVYAILCIISVHACFSLIRCHCVLPMCE